MSVLFSCRDAARAISDRQDGRAVWHRRLALVLHLLLCAACRAYRRQITAIDRLLRRGPGAPSAGSTDGGIGGLPQISRARLIQRLRDRNLP